MPTKLAIIFGGQSSEHDVSLSSARGVISALDKEKYDLLPVAITKDGQWLVGDRGQHFLEKQVIGEDNLDDFIQAKVDLALPIIHGAYAEDGKLQGMLEMFGIPYLFSDTLASALAMNKPLTKIIVEKAGVNVLPSCVLSSPEDKPSLNLPLVIKPDESGSSVGISIATTEGELTDGIKNAFTHSSTVMLEQFQTGRELTVGIVGNQKLTTLPVIEIIPVLGKFYDYKAKYATGGSDHVCPADIPKEIKDKVEQQTRLAYQAIGCRDLARADFIWNEQTDEVYFLEINTIPGMTPTSLVPEAAKASGLSFSQFLDQLIAEGLHR